MSSWVSKGLMKYAGEWELHVGNDGLPLSDLGILNDDSARRMDEKKCKVGKTIVEDIFASNTDRSY